MFIGRVGRGVLFRIERSSTASSKFIVCFVWCEDPESSHMWSKFAPIVSSSSSSSAPDIATGQFRVCVRAHEFK